MKKSYKLMVSLLVVFTIITNLFLNSLTVSAETMLNYNIDNKVIAYAKDNYKEIAETFFNATVLEDLTDMAYNNYSVSELKLGKGFIVYNLQCEVQDEIYYFPIIYDDKIILLLSVIGTTDGYVLSATTNWVDELNSVGVNSGDVFFADKQSLISYNRSNKAEIICGIKSSTINKMSKLSYHEKVKLVNKRKNVMKKKECSYNGKGVNLKDKYTPDFSSNTSSSVSCALYNEQTQGDYGLCWAASIATIYNYRNGTDLTAKQVADRAGNRL